MCASTIGGSSSRIIIMMDDEDDDDDDEVGVPMTWTQPSDIEGDKECGVLGVRS